MNPVDAALIFADAKVGAPFLIALLLGLMAVAGFMLLRPWPPRPAKTAVFVAVLGICGSALGFVLLDHRVVIDPAQREVVERSAILGLALEDRWAFRQFESATVTHVPVKVKRGAPGDKPAVATYEMHDNFVLELVGPEATVRLQSFEDAMEAEAQARIVAGTGKWRARRSGYELRSGTGKAEEGFAAGNLQAFETPGGKQAIGVSFDTWVKITLKHGASSDITP